MSFTIVTDSASDVTGEIAQLDDVFIIPTTIILDGKEYLEGEIEFEKLTNLIDSSEKSTTSQPSIQQSYDVYKEALDSSDNGEILGIHISSKLSGTFNSARNAIEEIEDGKIKLFDTYNVSFGSGYFVYLATKLREKGFSMKETINMLEKKRNKVHFQVLISALDRVQKSGRLNLGIYYFLRLFGIKAIITNENGKIKRSGLSLGDQSGINKLSKKLISYDVGPEPILIYAYAIDKSNLKILKKRLSDLNTSEEIEVKICGTLMVHTGSQVVGAMVAPSIDTVINNQD